MLVTKALSFAEPDAVDNRGVVQLIADHRILVAEQSLEQAAVRVEGAWIQNRVLGAQKSRQCPFQFLMYVLRPANKPDTGHSEPVAIKGFFGGGDQCRMIGQ